MQSKCLRLAKPYDPNFMKEVNEEEELLCGPGTGLRRIIAPQQINENFSRGRNGLKRECIVALWCTLLT